MTEDRGGPRRRLARFLADAFVARQIIVRAAGRVRYVEVSSRLQAGVALLALGLVGWSLVAAVGAWRTAEIAASRAEAIANAGDAQRDLAESRRALRRLLDENDQLRTGLAATETRLRASEAEREHVTSDRALVRRQTARLEVELQRIATESDAVALRLRASEAERERVVADHASVRRQTARIESELQRVATENDALARHLDSVNGRMQALSAQNDALAALRATKDGRVETLDRQLADALARVARLDAELRVATAQLARSEEDRDANSDASGQLRGRVTELEARLATAEDLHRRTVQRYDEQALAGILQVEALVGRTGIRIETLLPGKPATAAPQQPRRRGGQGGPFVPWRPREAPPSTEELRISLAERIDRLELLRDLVRALPLGTPLDEPTIMSGFGYRRDPLNSAAAMHLGVDLSAPMRSPVYPTASGRVVFAGWQTDMGRIVEIDHGFGLRTRYAHLARTLVEAGDSVTVERPIGLLGNSGRTTGPHLHYEVLVKGKNVDPEKFMRAPDHVQQTR